MNKICEIQFHFKFLEFIWNGYFCLMHNKIIVFRTPWKEPFYISRILFSNMQLVRVHDKVMNLITLFHSGRGYYRGNIRISWKFPCSVDIICTSRKYQHSVDIIFVLLIYLYTVDIIRILWILSAFHGYHQSWPYHELPSL